MGTLKRAALYLGVLLLGMTIGALLLAYTMAGEIYEYQDTVDGVHLPEVDAIVCLAGGKGRIGSAGDIWYRYWELSRFKQTVKPPVLYLSGMGHSSTWPIFVHFLRRGVQEVIHPENVVIEKESLNTDENARYLERFAREHGWQHILLITSPYHMKRARFMFEKILQAAQTPGRSVTIDTYSILQEPFAPGEWRGNLHGIKVTVIEYLKWVYYKSFWRP